MPLISPCVSTISLYLQGYSIYGIIIYRSEVVTMPESKLAVSSMDFAVKILKLCDIIKGHYSIVNQLERSATSIGANIREANYAHSKPDFVSKLQISLKECYETEYWLELMLKAELLQEDVAKVLLHDCGSIRKMLVSSINTIKSKE
jgi:four helix bundle protein